MRSGKYIAIDLTFDGRRPELEGFAKEFDDIPIAQSLTHIEANCLLCRSSDAHPPPPPS
jgi:hypothetical protein